MRGALIRHWLPPAWRAPLWGDRERWGLRPVVDDPCWQQWQQRTVDFYEANQRAGIGRRVNDAGYRVMAGVDLEARRVLEVGPGDIRHAAFWRGRPREVLLADVNRDMLHQGERRMQEAGVPVRAVLVRRGEPLPLDEGSIDVIVSFYSLEHLYPLGPYLDDWRRVLRPGGRLVGAIPAEGGLAWGLGRMLTSRRWLHAHTDIDPDKIICWEHPNFAEDVLAELDRRFVRERVRCWPFAWLPTTDVNLIIRLVYRRPDGP
jgi:SAM-dependent methyltransferase